MNMVPSIAKGFKILDGIIVAHQQILRYKDDPGVCGRAQPDHLSDKGSRPVGQGDGSSRSWGSMLWGPKVKYKD